MFWILKKKITGDNFTREQRQSIKYFSWVEVQRKRFSFVDQSYYITYHYLYFVAFIYFIFIIVNAKIETESYAELIVSFVLPTFHFLTLINGNSDISKSTRLCMCIRPKNFALLLFIRKLFLQFNLFQFNSLPFNFLFLSPNFTPNLFYVNFTFTVFLDNYGTYLEHKLDILRAAYVLAGLCISHIKMFILS